MITSAVLVILLVLNFFAVTYAGHLSITVSNQCPNEITIAIVYLSPTGEWKLASGQVQSGSTLTAAHTHEPLFYARASQAADEWPRRGHTGDITLSVGNEVTLFRRLQMYDVSDALQLYCQQEMTALKQSPIIIDPNNPYSFPSPREIQFLVSLQDEYGQHRCGGTLIAPQYVLTAAHCQKERLHQAQVGVHRQTEKDTSAFVETRRITFKKVHPGHDGVVFCDIMLLKLDSPITRYEPLWKLDQPGTPIVATIGKHFSTAGWGKTQDGSMLGGGSDVPLRTRLPIIDQTTCEEKHMELHKIGESAPISSTMICAGIGGVGTCNYDSGGPLYGNNSRGETVLVGIVSFAGTETCAEPGLPEVFTRVRSFFKWVSLEMKKPTGWNPGCKSHKDCLSTNFCNREYTCLDRSLCDWKTSSDFKCCSKDADCRSTEFCNVDYTCMGPEDF